MNKDKSSKQIHRSKAVLKMSSFVKKNRFIAFLCIFAAIGGGFMAYQSFASTTEYETQPLPSNSEQEVDQEISGWRLEFADEFDGNGLDQSLWKISDKEETAYCNSDKNIRLTDDTLRLIINKNTNDCKSGQIISGATIQSQKLSSHKNSKWETRLRLSHMGNNILGGLIAVYANDSSRPQLDIFYYSGSTSEPINSSFYPAVTFNETNGCVGISGCGAISFAHWPHKVTEWHTIAVTQEQKVTKNKMDVVLSWFVDGNLIGSIDGAGIKDAKGRLVQSKTWQHPSEKFPYPFTGIEPHNIVLSAGIGNKFTTIAPFAIAQGFAPDVGTAYIEYDYVKYYSKD